MELKEKISVMRAHLDGEKIQMRPRENTSAFGEPAWETTAGPEWNWAYYEYRVAPKRPVKVWGRRPYGSSGVVQTSIFERVIDEYIKLHGGTKLSFTEDMT